MPATLLIPIFVGLFIVLLAGYSALTAGKMPWPTRLLAIVVFAPLTLFCMYGFAASMEPGDFHIVWRVIYAVCFIACISSIARLLLARRSGKTSD